MGIKGGLSNVIEEEAEVRVERERRETENEMSNMIYIYLCRRGIRGGGMVGSVLLQWRIRCLRENDTGPMHITYCLIVGYTQLLLH